MKSRIIIALCFILLLPTLTWGAEYYVRVNGTKSAGPSSSDPDNWDLINCYPTIQAAYTQASNSDAIILYPETHTIGAGDTYLLAALKQKDDSQDYTQCIVTYDYGGQLRNNPNEAQTLIQGITFRDNPIGSGKSALLLRTQATQAEITITINHCAFLNNKGQYLSGGRGSAIQVTNVPEKLTLHISDSLFEGNESLSLGGAVFLTAKIGGGSTSTIFNTQFLNNKAGILLNPIDNGQGGAIYATMSGSNLELTHVTISGNTAGAKGGGAQLLNGNYTLVDCIVRQNKLNPDKVDINNQQGAGINFNNFMPNETDISVSISDCIFSGNQGSQFDEYLDGFDGGNLHFKGDPNKRISPITISDTEFSDGYSKQGAGVYFGRYTANILVERCLFQNNIAYGSAGGVYKGGGPIDCVGETAIFNYCQFIGNKAGYDISGTVYGYSVGSGRGGGLGCRLNPKVVANNCVFLNNLSKNNGDGFSHDTNEGPADSDNKRCALYNCLFWGTGVNDEIYTDDNPGNSEFTAIDHCAFGVGEITAPDTIPKNSVILTGNPCVSLLDGSLHESSPCIDTGIFLNGLHDQPFVTDFVGVAVPQGPLMLIDIGAFEFDPSAVGVSSAVSGGGGGGGGCFIATAAYGSPMNRLVKVLCMFRDRILLKNDIGSAFVEFYYTYSPPLAHLVAEHNILRVIVCMCLLPVVGVCWTVLHFSSAGGLLIMVMLILGGGYFYSLTRKR